MYFFSTESKLNSIELYNLLLKKKKVLSAFCPMAPEICQQHEGL